MRWSTGGDAPTDYTFTSQRNEASLGGLMDYRARYYDVALNRFIQADSMIPDPGSSQAHNRYMYVYGSPLLYTDPSGHFGVGVIIGLVVATGLVLSIPSSSAQPTPPHDYSLSDVSSSRNRVVNGGGSVGYCDTLAGCFSQSAVLSPNMPGVTYSQDEFYALADEIAADLYSHNVTSPGFLTGRDSYDTPFYNLGGKLGLSGSIVDSPFSEGQSVCIEGLICSDRSAVNYIAQGMWGARSGESLYLSHNAADFWKNFYHEEPSAEVLYWLEFGYNYYLDWLLENYGDDWDVVRYVMQQRGETEYEYLPESEE